MTYQKIELKLYVLRKLGFTINDKIYMKAIKQRALLESNYGKCYWCGQPNYKEGMCHTQTCDMYR